MVAANQMDRLLPMDQTKKAVRRSLAACSLHSAVVLTTKPQLWASTTRAAYLPVSLLSMAVVWMERPWLWVSITVAFYYLHQEGS